MKNSTAVGELTLVRALSGVLALLCFAAGAHAADGTWTNWAGGAWSTDSNWQALTIPDAGTANLTNTVGSYGVDYDTVSPSIKNLNVSNVAPKTTGLTISAPLTHLGGAAIRIGAGARVAVTNNGVWTYTGTNNATDGDESMFCIKNGGEVLISGGSVTFTNIPRSSSSYYNKVSVGYQSTGTLNVASGRFDLWDISASPNISHQLAIGRGAGGVGNMTLSGGTVALGIQSSGQTPLTIGDGGTGALTISGGALICTNTLMNAIFFGMNNGCGTVVVTNAGLIAGAKLQPWIGRGNKACGVLKVFAGSATFNKANVGYMDSAGSATGHVDVAGGTVKFESDVWVGYGQDGGNGRGTFGSRGGATSAGYYYGLLIGYGKNGGNGTGTLNVSGQLTVASIVDATYTSGLLIGYIPERDNNAATRAQGELIVSGGAITNAGMFVVGANGATGTVTQTGGSIVQSQNASYHTAIGFGRDAATYFKGGYGSYTMQGGTYMTRNRTFIGGVPTSILASANPGSVGVLEVAGGTFTCSNTLYVAANGTGTLTVGNGGRVHCDDLQIANSTSGTLRFNVQSSWNGLAKVKNTVTVAAGAKLVIDLTDYVPEVPTAVHLLLDATARSGSFAEGDITWINPSEHLVGLEQLADGDLRLTVQDPRGTVILLR